MAKKRRFTTGTKNKTVSHQWLARIPQTLLRQGNADPEEWEGTEQKHNKEFAVSRGYVPEVD